ncbi:serine-threonine kinase [Paraconexibacter sp. AEG42_29]|uniref:non-specific serine/threonine protein kinase n=1 Tax=Paraconexibacter sp. AEG42_29 TaxID=2997339 RepID=A0AAU7B1Q8_9ACTN
MNARWIQVTPSEFPWERDALAFLKQRLPDHEPYRAWANFEFLQDGAIGEVDVLVVAPKGVFLIEIKSWPGRLEGDAGTWRNTRPGEARARSLDNPLLVTNRKAKRLKSLLGRQRAFRGERVPFVSPLIFLSHEELDCRLPAEGKAGVHGLDDSETQHGLTGVVAALSTMTPEEHQRLGNRRIDKPMAKRITEALEQAGIRPSQQRRHVGDLELGELIDEGPSYQDFAASHPRFSNSPRRVRIYGTPDMATAAQREQAARAAQREFELLEPLGHPGIVSALAFHEHELGPAIVFARDLSEIRLDHYLDQYGSTLTLFDRLGLVRQLAETVLFAHRRRVFHRALSPRSVMVARPGTKEQRFSIINWQTGERTSGETLAATVVGTRHVEQLVDDDAAAYLAPEALTQAAADAQLLDVFSLGAIAFHVFTGKPPATSLAQLIETLQRDGALEVASVLDGAGANLAALVRESTEADTASRIASVADFLVYLDAVEEEVTAPLIDVPDPEKEVNLEEVPKGELLAGFKVQRRLGRGSTAIAFLVTDADEQLRVLKVAADPDRNERVRDEGEVLTKLRDRTIVAAFGDPVDVAGHTAIVLAYASEGTLAQRLRTEGRLLLDNLDRWGQDLLSAVSYLEQVGIPHRDIKPENLGIMELGPRKLRQLVLMDFSLARAPVENIRAGTPPYLDPFLGTTSRARWDLAADRFAAAMTLHEMAAGSLPTWGDGRGDPKFAAGEAHIERDAFPREAASGLGDFFERALRRDASDRHDTAEEMLRAWRAIFESLDQQATNPTHDPTDIERARQAATFETPLAAIGLSARATNALERVSALAVGDLLAIPPFEFNRLRGVGLQTRNELVEVHRELRGRLGTPSRPSPLPPTQGPVDVPDVQPLDELVNQLIPARTGRNATEVDALRLVLGLDALDSAGDWPSQSEVAQAINVTSGRVGQIVPKARKRWQRLPSVMRLRDELVTQLERLGGIAGSGELERLVAGERGTGDTDRDRALATAAVRAAVESEASHGDARLTTRRAGQRVILSAGGGSVADRQAAAEYAVRLGTAADELAALPTLPAPTEVAQRLRAVRVAADVSLTQERLVQVAASSSQHTAVSARLELYPRNLPAVRALALGGAALLGAPAIEPAEVRRRIAARFPDAEPLPDRPALDGLLRDAAIDLHFDRSAGESGAYVAQSASSDLTGMTSYASSLNRQATAHVMRPPRRVVDPAVTEAQAFETRLETTLAGGGLLTLMVEPSHLGAAARELQRFAVTPVDLDALVLDKLHAAAAAANVRWDLVLGADGAERASQDWGRLTTLVSRAMPTVEQDLITMPGTIVLEHAGLLARYGQLSLVDRLRAAMMRDEPLRGCWLLVPADGQADLPLVDGEPIPVIGPNEWTRIPGPWLENRHRSGDDAQEDAA